MRQFASVTLFFLFVWSLNAQERIDGSFSFQTDPAKKYSIYIPTSYDGNSPHALMLGLHPLNTARWDAASWCDTLLVFAEINNIILVCPDGGPDGAVDDAIDLAFTTALLDSMEVWFQINPDKVYAMGFSWGGRTTYSYGLQNIDRFAGFIPIGAAISIGDVQSVMGNADDKPFYLVHGQNDNPNVRFYPLREALIENDACVESILMPGIGHTIDFPNRNMILSDAFSWVKDNACVTLATQENTSSRILIFPNPVKANANIEISGLQNIIKVTIFSYQGNLIQEVQGNQFTISQRGSYIIKISSHNKDVIKKIVVI